jgi:NAD(P)H dehydrogenase (quinone)
MDYACQDMSTVQVYVIYDGDPDGPIDRLAHAVADGAASVDGASVLMHTAQQARVEDMVAADAIILGSPNWHGMTADLKAVIDQTGLIWEQGKLVGKVGAAFTSGWSRAGGQEITLLTLLHTLLAHGMLIVGLPWSKRMVKSGSYYGPTASGGPNEDDLAQAQALGRRVARYATWLKRGRGDSVDEIEGGLFYRPRRGHVVKR